MDNFIFIGQEGLHYIYQTVNADGTYGDTWRTTYPLHLNDNAPVTGNTDAASEDENNIINETRTNGFSGDGPEMEPYIARKADGSVMTARGGWTNNIAEAPDNLPYASGSESILSQKFPGAYNGRSYSITALKGRSNKVGGYTDPNYLVDTQGTRPYYDMLGSESGLNARKPTTSAIIQWAKENEMPITNGVGGNKRPYKYTDFVFCKYWNKIPNNHMITLRRYAYPVTDNLEFPGEQSSGDSGAVHPDYYSPFAQAITYLGEDTGNTINSLFTMEAMLKYKAEKSQVHVVSNTPAVGAEGGIRGTQMLAQVLGVVSGSTNFDRIRRGGTSPNDPYEGGPYANKVYGPINVIQDIQTREQGLEFKQSFTLQFHYIARPIGGVNTKVAMMEIIANLLVLCYAEGSFWGGAHRFTGGSPAYPFLGGDAGADAFYRGDIPGFLAAFQNQLSAAKGNVSAFLGSLLTGNPIDKLMDLAMGAGKIMIGDMLATRRQNIANIPALLTGAPVGEWHLTIGNPFNPMMEIGNLVCTGIKFEFGNELGPDDFPLELTASISLEHGMARDSAMIQSMFNRGGGKIYHLPDEFQFPEAFGEDGRSFKSRRTGTRGGTQKTVNKVTNDFSGASAESEKIINTGKDAFNKGRKASSAFLETVKMGFGYGDGIPPQ